VHGPRLVVWGADDTVDSVAAGRATAALLRTRFVEIPAAGHLSMLAAPAAVARAIDEFAARAQS
jgi:pimeloyl-ACP methyl ester carboxylesterase